MSEEKRQIFVKSKEFSLGDMYVHIVPIGNGFGAGTKFMADTISVSHIRTVISA